MGETLTIAAEPAARAGMAGRLHVECVASERALAGMAAEWNRLAAKVPFRRWEWLGTWWRHFRREHDRLCVLLVRDEMGQLCGVAPWYLTRTKAGGRELRFLGSDGVCSEYLTLLCRPGSERQIAEEIAAWLDRSRGVVWHTLSLSAVDVEDAAIRYLMAAMCRRGSIVRTWRGATAWHVDLPDDWNSYLATLSSKRRAHIRRICRRHLDNRQASLRRAHSEDELIERLELLAQLSGQRDRCDDEKSAFECPRFSAFLHDAARLFHRLGKLEVKWIETEGKPVAVDCSFVDGGVSYGYQMAMDQTMTKVEPGWMLLISLIRDAQQRGLWRFDFLRGSESYKTQWRATATPLMEVRIAARTAAACTRDCLWTAQENGKALMKYALRRLGLRYDRTITRPRRLQLDS